jgi:hypothetical protein
VTKTPASWTAPERNAGDELTSAQVSRAMLAGLVLLTLFGAYFRLEGLDRKSISHPELFVPNIELPMGASVPNPRYTLAKVISGTYSADAHPPGYYLMMWGWTKLFGTRAVSIRLPGALLGVASIPLLFWVATLAGRPRAGLLGAALLAANGSLIYFSQYARMFTLACALGLLATGFLLLLVAGKGPRRWLEVGYVLTIVLGVNVHVFFWTLFAAQMAWMLANSHNAGKKSSPALRLQFLALILGLPALAFSIYQSSAPIAALSSRVLPFVREYISFSFLFPLQQFPESLTTDHTPFSGTDALSMMGRYLLFVVSVILLVAGLRALKGSGSGEPGPESAGPGRAAWWIAAGLSSLSIAVFVLVARKVLGASAHPTLRTVAAMTAAPPLVALLAPVVVRLWAKAPSALRGILENPFFLGGAGLLALEGWLPFAIVALASLSRPLLNQRGLVFAAPYLLFVLAAGTLAIAKTPVARTAVAGALVVLHAGSIVAYRQMPLSVTDYKAFASTVIPRVHSSDLLFLAPNWSASPIYFYMKPHEFPFVTSNFAAACRNHPDARVIVLLVRRQTISAQMSEALAGYRETEQLHSNRETAIFFTRVSPTGVKEPLLMRKR